MSDTDIAITGFSCRLPGAKTPGEFWQLLDRGESAASSLSEDDLRRAGLSDEQLRDPAWVRSAMLLADIDRFDAGFFGFSPRDAAIMDPQHRVFLEACWEAFESAGHVPESFDGRVGVFAGCGMNTYLLHNILTNPDLVREIGMFLIRHTGNDKDFLSTRVSYEFDLRGPSVNVLTACSTSLVAIHQAAQSLLAGESDMALAGGVTILVPQDRGYRYEAGEILSPDGECRAFDRSSKGTVFGSGAGVVVLRRLEDALADGDRILAVVAGSAVNNDGARKVSYLAPSVDGYSEVVAEALALADEPADRVQYVEAHGTGTPVGDPIEIEALTQAFRVTTEERGFCSIGSAKTNIGHLDTAAGVAGLIKTVLAMQAGRVPKSLHFESPNEAIDFERSPFRVAGEAVNWPTHGDGVRVAGVSSLGVGGTNAHVVLRQQIFDREPAAPYPHSLHVLPLSAGTGESLRRGAARLADHLEARPDQDLADVAFTLQVGRRGFSHRYAVAGATREELVQRLRSCGDEAPAVVAPSRRASVVFLFPGGGAQYPGMGRELHASNPTYRRAVEQCFEALPAEERTELVDLLFGGRASAEFGANLQRPGLALPALFATEYALARTLMELGIEAEAMLGHSMGEYVAACLAGAFTPAVGMKIVALRGALFEEAPQGSMVSVPLSASELEEMEEFRSLNLSVAAANAPGLCAAAGSVDAVESLESQLGERGVETQRLRIDVAAHSHLLDSILDQFREGLRDLPLGAAQKPFVSNVTGDWIDPAATATPEYWVEHLRSTVRFDECVARLLEDGDRVFVEVGPGQALTQLVRLHPAGRKSRLVAALPHAKDGCGAGRSLLESVGQLWAAGVNVSWLSVQGGARSRVELPTYAFEPERHWVEPGAIAGRDQVGAYTSGSTDDLARRDASTHLEALEFSARPMPGNVAPRADARWLVIGDGAGLAQALTQDLVERGLEVVRADGRDLDEPAEVDRLLVSAWSGAAPVRIAVLHGMDGESAGVLVTRQLRLMQGLAKRPLDAGVRMLTVTGGLWPAGAAGGVESADPATLPAFSRVAAVELPEVVQRVLDVDRSTGKVAAHLQREIEATDDAPAFALREGIRLAARIAPVDVPHAGPVIQACPPGAMVWITGGLSGMGLRLAEAYGTTRGARLLLTGRRGLPPRQLWDEWLERRKSGRVSEAIATIRRIEAAGGVVEVGAGDVADPTAMSELLVRANARFDAHPHTVIHAAGILDDGLIQLRDVAQVQRMLRPKVEGAKVLDQVTAISPPEVMVLCSSVSGWSGVPGQSDYAAANAFLDAFAVRRDAHRHGRTIAMAWGVWRDGGMLRGQSLRVALPNEADVPAILGVVTTREGALDFTSTWSAQSHWVLSEHRLGDGRAVLPGTGTIEILWSAARCAADGADVALVDLELPTPMVFAPGEERRVVVTVEDDGDGLRLRLESRGRGDEASTIHAVARGSSETRDPSALVNLVPPMGGSAGQTSPHIAFGPRWNCVVGSQTEGAVTTVGLKLDDAFTQDLAEHPLHPALLDMAFGVAVPALGADPETLFAPVGCDRVSVFGPLPADMLVSVERDPSESGALRRVDVRLYSVAGVPVAALEGLSLLGLESGFAHDAGAATPGVRSPAGSRARAPVPVPPVTALVAGGITVDEGVAAIENALGGSSRHVLAAPFNIAATARWLATPRSPVRTSRSVERDQGRSAGPRDEIERCLATAYSELLGVEGVGLESEFFDLGGHSLLAVRLFARIHSEFGVDLELATLLRAGTVRELAAVLREQLGQPEPESESRVGPSVPAFKGQHLVPIQTKGDRPNLFLVHGAGGNVLGFRDLGHYLGMDQPLYGLQARGVDGRSKPHDSIPVMASAYLEEVRLLQPEGPYFLGGYSGGGCVAYEMAQQLVADGQEVAFIGMIDTPSPQMKERSKLSRGLLHLKRVARSGPLYPFRMVQQKVQGKLRQRTGQRARAESGDVLPVELRGALMQESFDAAFFRYDVRPYPGRVWMFRARDESRTKFVRDLRLGWGDHPQGGMETVDCPGNHYSMCVEPNIQTLCRHMRRALDEVVRSVAGADAPS